MRSYLLDLFFKLSSYTFKIKQRIVQAESLARIIPYAILLIFVEFWFFIISLPLYFLVSPASLQEEGIVFPGAMKSKEEFHVYTVRRKISLATIVGGGGLFLAKLVFVAIVSFYFLGIQKLLADVQDWTFDVPGDYTYDGAKIEVTGGVAQLKNIGTTTTGSTTNSGFDTASTGWTYADWLDPGQATASGTHQSSGGNPGGYVDVSLSATAGSRTVAGYWRQSFTTTVSSPTTATLNMDWSSITFTSPTAPVTYQLYAFIDTASTDPTLGTQVWSSGEITSTTAWASISAVDITSKIPTAGTYYLKFAAYTTTPSPNTTYAYVSGFDNVIVDWSKTDTAYDTTNPTINPVSSLAVDKAISWNSFNETATKNGGEIYYQLSSDNGSSWQYWNGSAWASAGATNYNIATDVNANIATFTTTANQIKWKAFLSSDGTQQVILDNISITYTQNALPNVQSLTASQDVTTGYVYVDYNLQDDNSDPGSLVTYEYSLTGAFAGEQVTMTAATGDPNHDGATGLTSSPTGIAHTFVWNAMSQLGTVYNTGVYVRLRANDGIGSGSYATSTAFTVDYVSSVVSNVSAVETLGTTNVQITYDLSDNTADNIFVELQISGDGGSTWTVPTTSATGAVGAGVTAGTGKTTTWNAGTDYSGQQKSNMQVRVRAKDKFQNQGGYATSANFSLDTLAPATLTQANLQAQPNAGDTTALIGGSFTEVNPNTNDFYLAINGGTYGSASSGDTNTATPSNKATAVGATLVGHDYISKVKIVHTDDYGHVRTSEDLSPNTSFKYVKPYTPNAPTVNNPQNAALDLTVNANVGEASDVEYAIYEVSTDKYVQANGTLGTGVVWKTLGTGAGQWGITSGVVGKITVSGLTSPVAQYSFKVKSRNPSDAAHATSSESNLSAAATISNTAPSITISSASQQLSGGYVSVNYTGSDAQNDTNNLTVFEYSTNNLTWFTMTEKSGVGSSGATGLVFGSAGTAYVFAWDASVDLPNQENSTVYVRLQSTDTIASSNLATSSAFYVDTVGPVISNINVSQTPSSGVVTIEYNLNDNSGSDNSIAITISSNSGSTYVVPTTTLAGDVGSGITSGASRIATWDANTDFPNQENSTMRARIQGTDRYGNTGNFFISSDFTVDTDSPVISSVTVSQVSGSDNVTINYTLSDITAAGNSVEFSVSSNSGSTWVVPATTVSGNIGVGQTTGAKTFTWDAGTDYSGHTSSTMKVRVRAIDYFGNQGSYVSSSNFTLDTEAPIITGITAVQNSGARTVTMHYDLDEGGTVNMSVSSDGGSTWSVITASTTGDVGTGITSGSSKTAIWDAGADFSNQENSNMRVRFQGIDSFGNASGFYESANFTVDTSAPIGLISLSKFSSTDTTVTMNWQATTDAHFDHYELWHGTVESDVSNRTGTADVWNTTDDISLSNSLTISTVITGITATDSYFIKIWAIDDFNNEATIAVINIFAPSAPSPTSTNVSGVAPISKPILSPVATPTKNTNIAIFGLADAGSFIDLYDKGSLIARFNSVANSSGRFNQIISFDPGDHSLTIKAISLSGVASDFSDPINFVITSEIPMTPIILSPNNNESIADANPTLIGVAAANSTIAIAIDNRLRFTTTADNNGSWSFRLPSSATLTDGPHRFVVDSTDAADNKSASATLSLTKITLEIAPIAPTTPAIGIPSEVVPIAPTLPGEISIPIPPSTIIREATEAVELAGIPVPKVTTVDTFVANNVFSFVGTSLPNKDVIVYMHSDQALIYRARTDNNGIWRVNHSQDVAELTPGDHTIYAVTLDTSAKVKSRPSIVSSFTVNKNFWVMIFGYLNIQTTIASLIVLSLTMLWLYRIRSRKIVNA